MTEFQIWSARISDGGVDTQGFYRKTHTPPVIAPQGPVQFKLYAASAGQLLKLYAASAGQLNHSSAAQSEITIDLLLRDEWVDCSLWRSC